MSTAFHLDSQPWLPVTYTDASVRHVSLRTLFTDAHNITGLVPATPAGHSGLLRILTALTYRVTGLDDCAVAVDDWHTARNASLAAGRFSVDAVVSYFDAWHERFDLFHHERPWRQEPALAQQCTKRAGLNSLFVERPAGNNPAFLSPFHDANPGPADITSAVQALLTVQFYGPLGRCSARTLPGRPSSANYTYVGPIRARVSYHPVAPTLFGTLLAHLVPPSSLPFAQTPTIDLAEWERPALSNPDGVKPSPKGIVSLLAADSGHAVLLVPGEDLAGDAAVTDAYISWAFTDKGSGNLIGWDPYMSYRTDLKRGRIPQMAQSGRDMWRDLPALLAPPDGAPPRPAEEYGQPRVTLSYAGLPAAFLATLRTAAHGFVQHAFQPTASSWSSDLSPAVFESAAQALDEPTAHQYRTAVPAWVAHADREAKVLNDVLRRALREARDLPRDSKAQNAWANAAMPVYWQRAYALFDEALSTTDSGAAFSATSTAAPAALRQVSQRLYDQATAAVRDPRGLRAVVQNRPRYLAPGVGPFQDQTPTSTPAQSEKVSTHA